MQIPAIQSRLPISYLRQRVLYEKVTGKLFWKPRDKSEFEDLRTFRNWEVRFSGKEAFLSKSKDGYRKGEIRFDGRRYHLLAHSAVWAICNGWYPSLEIDHINGVRDDNRIENLREATRAQNIYNTVKRGKFLPGSYPSGSRWASSITIDGKSKHLGLFSTEKEAHQAYVAVVNKERGEYSPFLTKR
jgi:hypothetical protein